MLLITRLLGIERDESFWAWTDTLIYGRVNGTSPEAVRDGRGLPLRLPRAPRSPTARPLPAART